MGGSELADIFLMVPTFSTVFWHFRRTLQELQYISEAWQGKDLPSLAILFWSDKKATGNRGFQDEDSIWYSHEASLYAIL